jgi:hypothetical protein
MMRLKRQGWISQTCNPAACCSVTAIIVVSFSLVLRYHDDLFLFLTFPCGLPSFSAKSDGTVMTNIPERSPREVDDC